MNGRFLFGPEATHDRLSELFKTGGSLKTTRLTEKFDYPAFQELYGDTALPLFAISEAGNVVVATVANPLKPRAGHTLVSLLRAGNDEPSLADSSAASRA